jgi:1-aminocyclopropane-1-carboxylate deaminase/D-cysteine desulfhydrase-like pyridoxal-dependent ACC family enzyme
MKATSFSRNAAAAGSSCGLDLHVVLAGTKSEQNPASQAIFSQCDTTLHYVPEGESALPDVYSHLVESLKSKGALKGDSVLFIHTGGNAGLFY